MAAPRRRGSPRYVAPVIPSEHLDVWRALSGYVRMRLGSDAGRVSRVRFGSWLAGQLPFRFAVAGREYSGYAVRLPVGESDSYVDVHVCWLSPCPSCGF